MRQGTCTAGFLPLMKRFCVPHGWRKTAFESKSMLCSCSPMTCRGPDVRGTLAPPLGTKETSESDLEPLVRRSYLIYIYKKRRKQLCGARGAPGLVEVVSPFMH